MKINSQLVLFIILLLVVILNPDLSRAANTGVCDLYAKRSGETRWHLKGWGYFTAKASGSVVGKTNQPYFLNQKRLFMATQHSRFNQQEDYKHDNRGKPITPIAYDYYKIKCGESEYSVTMNSDLSKEPVFNFGSYYGGGGYILAGTDSMVMDIDPSIDPKELDQYIGFDPRLIPRGGMEVCIASTNGEIDLTNRCTVQEDEDGMATNNISCGRKFAKGSIHSGVPVVPCSKNGVINHKGFPLAIGVVIGGVEESNHITFEPNVDTPAAIARVEAVKAFNAEVRALKVSSR
jgi:hypothetical protein